MFLTRIILHDFKNIAEAEVTFSPKVNYIYGSNGAGKTNLLDAIYYLSMTKSYFSASDQYVYAYGAPEATLCGFYRMDGGTEEKIAASIRRGGEKVFRRGAKTYARFSEHERMEPHAAYVHQARRILCEQLRPLIREFYATLSRGKEEVDLAYRSDLDEAPLGELFAREAERERVLRYTTAGIQRDDLSFRLDGHSLRRSGSQGQQKSFLLATKLAQFRFVRDVYGQTPILLLDDVFDKLDMQRVEDLLALVSTLDFGQIFLTDSNKVRLEDVSRRIDAPCRSYRVDAGNITAE